MPTTLASPKPLLADLSPLSVLELVRRAAVGVENFDGRVFQLSDEQLDTAFLPDAGIGQWPIRVLLGHLADAEMVFVHRVRRIVGEERPVLPNWDEQAFIDGGVYDQRVMSPGMPPANPGGFVAVIYTMRAWTCEWLASLDASMWTREGMHPMRGVQTLRRVCEYNTWHLESHAWYLNAKVERFLGPAPAVQSGGCGAGCGCHGGAGQADGSASALQHADSAEGCGKPGCCKS